MFSIPLDCSNNNGFADNPIHPFQVTGDESPIKAGGEKKILQVPYYYLYLRANQRGSHPLLHPSTHPHKEDILHDGCVCQQPKKKSFGSSFVTDDTRY